MKQNTALIKKLYSAILIILSLCICTGCCGKKRTVKETEEITMGIDVARYQGTIDWEQVADSGVEFAIVRVGYRGMENGLLSEDANGRYNLQEASKVGIKLGAYFFSTAVNEEEAREEAAWLAQILDGYPITYPVVYDCEGFRDPQSRQYHMTREERTDAAIAFLEAIEDLGYEGMFYASKVDMENENHWETARIEKDYKIWVAQYPAEPYPQTAQSSYSGLHHMWQYTMEGKIPGITQNVDRNIAYFGYDGIEPAKSKETPAEVKPDVEALMDFDEVSEQVTAKSETNLRSIPSQDTDSQVLDTLQNGEVAHRIAVSNSGWSKLVYEGKTYYAVSSYLTTDLKYGYDTDIVISAEANPDDIQTKFHDANQKVTAKDKVNLRSLPSVEHEEVEVIAQLKNGEVATCIGTSDNGWSKLIYRGTTCYAISSYLEILSEQDPSVNTDVQEEFVGVYFKTVNETVSAKEKVNLRTMPSTEDTDSKIVTQLYSGDVAIRIGISDNGWSKLVYNGTTCYAVSRYLVVDDTAIEKTIKTKFDAVNDRVTAKDEVNLRSMPSVDDPGCVVVARLKNGEVITRTGINEEYGWSRVDYHGQTLYCISSYLEKAN